MSKFAKALFFRFCILVAYFDIGMRTHTMNTYIIAWHIFPLPKENLNRQ